jgi:hypothetical protein
MPFQMVCGDAKKLHFVHTVVFIAAQHQHMKVNKFTLYRVAGRGYMIITTIPSDGQSRVVSHCMHGVNCFCYFTSARHLLEFTTKKLYD